MSLNLYRHPGKPNPGFDQAMLYRMYEGARLQSAELGLGNFFEQPMELPEQVEYGANDIGLWTFRFSGISQSVDRGGYQSSVTHDIPLLHTVEHRQPIRFRLSLMAVSNTALVDTPSRDPEFITAVVPWRHRRLRNCTTFDLETTYSYAAEGPENTVIRRSGQYVLWGIHPDTGKQKKLARRRFDPISGYRFLIGRTAWQIPNQELMDHGKLRRRARLTMGEYAVQADMERVHFMFESLKWKAIEQAT